MIADKLSGPDLFKGHRCSSPSRIAQSCIRQGSLKLKREKLFGGYNPLYGYSLITIRKFRHLIPYQRQILFYRGRCDEQYVFLILRLL